MTEPSNASNAPAPPAPAPAASAAPAPSQAAPPAADPTHGFRADFEAVQNRDTAAHVEHAVSMTASEVQAEAERLRKDPKSALWVDGPDHARAVAVNYRAYELDAAKAGQAEEMTVGQRVHNRNLQHIFPKELGGDPRALENDVEFGNLMKWADSENVATPLLGELLSEYANNVGSGQLSDAAMDQMEAKFRGRLRGDQIALLRRWVKAEVNPALAREAARRRR